MLSSSLPKARVKEANVLPIIEVDLAGPLFNRSGEQDSQEEEEEPILNIFYFEIIKNF